MAESTPIIVDADPLRVAISAAHLKDEADAVAELITAAKLPEETAARVHARAAALMTPSGLTFTCKH